MKYSLNVFAVNRYSGLKSFLRAFRYAKQRIARGWADCDVWEMNTHITAVISGMLKTLAETDNGYSSKFSCSSAKYNNYFFRNITSQIIVYKKAYYYMNNRNPQYYINNGNYKLLSLIAIVVFLFLLLTAYGSSLIKSGVNEVTLSLFGGSLQPAEFLKVFLIVYMGAFYGSCASG